MNPLPATISHSSRLLTYPITIAAVRLIMQQQDRALAAGLAIGQQHRAQLAHQRIRRWHRVGSRTSRAGCGALAAPGADVRIDCHMVAGRRDRAGGAEIEAARAAHDLGARMGAQRRVEGDIARLLEGADEIARLQYGLQHRGWIAGIGAQIAVAQVGCGKQRRSTGKIENDIAARPCAIARRSKRQHVA